jgi:transposase
MIAQPKQLDEVLDEAKANRQATQQCLFFEFNMSASQIRAIFEVSTMTIEKNLQQGLWENRSSKQKEQARRGAKAVLAWLGQPVDDADHVSE